MVSHGDGGGGAKAEGKEGGAHVMKMNLCRSDSLSFEYV